MRPTARNPQPTTRTGLCPRQSPRHRAHGVNPVPFCNRIVEIPLRLRPRTMPSRMVMLPITRSAEGLALFEEIESAISPMSEYLPRLHGSYLYFPAGHRRCHNHMGRRSAALRYVECALSHRLAQRRLPALSAKAIQSGHRWHLTGVHDSVAARSVAQCPGGLAQGSGRPWSD